MNATDQQKDAGLLDQILERLKDKERLGNAAMGLASQPTDTQVMPMHFGGGLLQMVPAPQMQYGVGITGSESGASREDKMEKMMQMMKLLGMGA
mgnify:FL=1